MNTQEHALLVAAGAVAGVAIEEWEGDPREWQPMFYEGATYHGWNPLKDDGDALRLAMRLHMSMACLGGFVEMFTTIAGTNYHARERIHGDDMGLAVRWAIVRVAAQTAGPRNKAPS